jgi:hypothetical protein
MSGITMAAGYVLKTCLWRRRSRGKRDESEEKLTPPFCLAVARAMLLARLPTRGPMQRLQLLLRLQKLVPGPLRLPPLWTSRPQRHTRCVGQPQPLKQTHKRFRASTRRAAKGTKKRLFSFRVGVSSDTPMAEITQYCDCQKCGRSRGQLNAGRGGIGDMLRWQVYARG